MIGYRFMQIMLCCDQQMVNDSEIYNSTATWNILIAIWIDSFKSVEVLIVLEMYALSWSMLSAAIKSKIHMYTYFIDTHRSNLGFVVRELVPLTQLF